MNIHVRFQVSCQYVQYSVVLLYQCIPAGSMVNFRSKGGPTQSPHMSCSCVHKRHSPILSALCAVLPPFQLPATSVLGHLVSERKHIHSVKTGEIAIPTLFAHRVMGLSCYGSVGKSPFPMMTNRTEEESFNKVAGCLHSSVPCGHHRHIHTSCNGPRFNELMLQIFSLF